MNDYVRLKIGEREAATDLDAPLKRQNTRNVVGSFYEALAAHLFDAVRWRGEEVYSYEEDRDADLTPDPNANPPCLIPDLVQRERATFIEVKGGNAWSQYKIYRWQAHVYDDIRRHATLPIYRPRVEYAIFMHNLRRMTKRQKTARRLIEALSGATECCVLMDLDVVLRFERWCGTAEYGSPEGRSHYPTFYTFSARHLRQLLTQPRQVLQQLELEDCEVDGRRIGRQFTVTRRTAGVNDRCPLFTRTLVGDAPLKPFPVLTVRRKRKPRPAYKGPIDKSWISEIRQEFLFTPPPDALDGLANEGGDGIPF